MISTSRYKSQVDIRDGRNLLGEDEECVGWGMQFQTLDVELRLDVGYGICGIWDMGYGD